MKSIQDLTQEDINAMRRKVADAIRANEGANYDQSVYIDFKEKIPVTNEELYRAGSDPLTNKMQSAIKSYNNCQTNCCIAGHTIMLSYEAIIEINDMLNGVGNFEGIEVTPYAIYNHAETILGLSYEEARLLFASWMDCINMGEKFDTDEEQKRENALRVARILDQLADGVSFDDAWKGRTTPITKPEEVK